VAVTGAASLLHCYARARGANRQKMCCVSATDPPEPGAEAPRAKRALRKIFVGILMPFCLIPCRLLALTARGRLWGARSRAETAVGGALRAHGSLLGRASRAGVSATLVAACSSSVAVVFAGCSFLLKHTRSSRAQNLSLSLQKTSHSSLALRRGRAHAHVGPVPPGPPAPARPLSLPQRFF
jgi:hypothetical protein